MSRRGTALQLSGRRANNPPPHQAEAPARGASVVKAARHRRVRDLRDRTRSRRPEPPPPAAVADARARAAAARPEPAPDLTVRPVTQTPTEAIDYAVADERLRRAARRDRALSARDREPVSHAEVPDPRRRDVRALEADRPREGRELDPPAVRRRAGRQPAPEGPPAALRGRRAARPARAARARGPRSPWSALRLHAPATGRTVATVLASSAGNDMLHAGFQWLCAGANTQARRPAEPAQPRTPSAVQPRERLVDVSARPRTAPTCA